MTMVDQNTVISNNTIKENEEDHLEYKRKKGYIDCNFPTNDVAL